MAIFNLGNDGGLFRHVIDAHDRGIDALRWMQGEVARPAVADALSDYLARDYPKHSDWQSYWRRNRHLAADAFRNPARGVHGRVFDPWDGVWSGQWNGAGGGTSPQRHVWDATVATNAGLHWQGVRHIQPVTQSESTFHDAGNTAEGWQSRKVDLGINVVTPGLGITGWVSKRQHGEQELPHVGYLLNPHTLIWITTDRPVPGSGVCFMMFFEWVGAGHQRYGIHGRYFTLSGGRVVRHCPGSDGPRTLTGWAEYDKTSLRR